MDKILESFNDASEQSNFSPDDVSSNKFIVAICSVVSILFFVPVLLNKDSNYCKYYGNQILTLFIAEAVVGVACAIMGIIPIIGAVVDALVVAATVCVIIGFVLGVWKGLAIKLPYIGDLIKLF